MYECLMEYRNISYTSTYVKEQAENVGHNFVDCRVIMKGET